MSSSHYCQKTKRYEVIQKVIDRLGAARYLEIGVASGKCFFTIDCATIIGVDPKDPSVLRHRLPAHGQYIQATSDRFFAELAGQILGEGIDVAFVDGFHAFPQALADIRNCLAHLRPGGCVIVHDCSPQSPEEEQSLTAREASQYAGPWAGDVWKAIAWLRATSSDLLIRTLNCDAGCAVIFRAETQQPLIELDPKDLDHLGYTDLDRDREKLLGLVDVETLDDILATQGSVQNPVDA
jgi:SAM-dependent methyltransferase